MEKFDLGDRGFDTLDQIRVAIDDDLSHIQRLLELADLLASQEKMQSTFGLTVQRRNQVRFDECARRLESTQLSVRQVLHSILEECAELLDYYQGPCELDGDHMGSLSNWDEDLISEETLSP